MIRHAFVCQACPVCGRPLQIREEYLGCQVTCPHCAGRFVARNASGASSDDGLGYGLMERVDRLLSLSPSRTNLGCAEAAKTDARPMQNVPD